MSQRSAIVRGKGSWMVMTAAAALVWLAGPRALGLAAQNAGPLPPPASFQGGMIVYLGHDPDALTALGERAAGSSLLLGLSTDADGVATARRLLRRTGQYGRLAMDHWDGKRLPLIENLANLLVADDPAGVGEAELLRVLAPEGEAWVRSADGSWKKLVKPRPTDMDEWTHYLHDASNNAVGHDKRVGPPRRMQWVGGPRWSRHHEQRSSVSALVSTGGRLFYVMDLASPLSNQLPPKWTLIARDAFNGVVLWRRPLASWHNYRWPLKSGPAQLPRRLAAVDDLVFATLSYDGPIEALDAVTGRTQRVFASTRGAEELLVSQGVLLALVNPARVDYDTYAYDTSNAICWVEKGNVAQRYPWNGKPRRIQAVDVKTGELLWEVERPVLPLSLAADGDSVYFHDGEKIIALDRRTARRRWQSPPAGCSSHRSISTRSTLSTRTRARRFGHSRRGGEWTRRRRSTAGVCCSARPTDASTA